MAQGSFILYGSKGKVGNIVAQRNKGKTIIREHVIPTNPRTKAQQLQRSRFGYLAKFYAEGVKQFFKFSFQNKRANESDYNAFMRENKANMLYATKQMLDNYDSCAFGQYRLTSGSIGATSDIVKWDEEYGQLEIMVADMTEDSTWGAISELLLAQHPTWKNGDILTVLTIADANPAATYCDNVADAIANNSYFKNNAGTIWRFVQVNINTTDTKYPADYGMGVEEGKLIVVPSTTEGSSSTLGGGSLVVSRNVPGGVEVSDSYLELGTGLKSHLDLIANDPAWIEHCASTMGGTEESILQGSLLESEGSTDKAFTASPKRFALNVGGDIVGWYNQRNMAPGDITIMIDDTEAPSIEPTKQSSAMFGSGYAMKYNWTNPGVIMYVECDANGVLGSAGNYKVESNIEAHFEIVKKMSL